MGTDQKVNVCHLASGDLWAGAEVQVYNIVSSLADLGGFNVSAIILNTGKLADKLTRAGIPISVIDESRHGFFDIVKQVKTHCRKNRIALLHTHRYKENIIGGMVKKAGCIEFLVQTVHGLPEPFSGLQKIKADVFNALNRHYTKKYFDRIQAVSSQIKSHFQEFIPEQKIRIVYNSINPDHIRFNRTKREILEELGIAPDAPVIGSVGRLVPIKAFDVLLRAAKRILESRPETRFIIVGDGPLRGELETLARELGLESAIIFTGYRNDALDVINSFSIFALSSHNEGVPTVVLEAMALNIPVVATAVGGVPEVIEDGRSGLLVSPGDPEAFARACLRLLNNPQEAERFRHDGQRAIEDKFTSRAQGSCVQDIYYDLTGIK